MVHVDEANATILLDFSRLDASMLPPAPLGSASQSGWAVARHSSRMSTAVVGSRSCTWRHAPPDPCILPEGMLYVIPRPGMLCGIPTGCHGPRIAMHPAPGYTCSRIYLIGYQYLIGYHLEVR